jgi:hypothetical protein
MIKVNFTAFQTMKPALSRTFSTYGDNNVMAVERYIMNGKNELTDEEVKRGFPVLSSQVMSYRGYLFNQHQQERWDMIQRRYMKL